jgi:hypothetical protein
MEMCNMDYPLFTRTGTIDMPIWLDPVISRVFHCFNELDNSSVHS